MMIAPASRSFVTTVASYGGRHPSRIFDEHVVGMPRVHMLSLRAIGTPASAPGVAPDRDGVVDLGRSGAGLVGKHEVERMDVALAPCDLGEMALDDLGRA